MNPLPDWTWACLALLIAGFVLVYLRSLAAGAHDILAVHELQHRVSKIRILQVKQLMAIRYGIHPGDVFGSEDQLDRLLANARLELSNDASTEANEDATDAGKAQQTQQAAAQKVNPEEPAEAPEIAGSVPAVNTQPSARAA